jgi:hypothetical protein
VSEPVDRPESPGPIPSQRQFLYPRSPYRGRFTPEALAFNANLQEFAQRISLICNLETGGKISQGEAYQQIKKLWDELQNSKQNLFGHSFGYPPYGVDNGEFDE